MSGATVSNGRRHLQMRRRRLQPEIEGEVAVLEDVADARDTIISMPGPSIPPALQIPRWVQLVGLPLLLLLLWTLAGAVRHVVFIFLVALLIALLLNPLVRGLGRVWIPRGLAVAIVYVSFAAVVALAILALATVVVQQTRHASHRVDSYFTTESGRTHQTGATHDLARLQHWLNKHHLKRVNVQKQGQKFLKSVGTKDVQKYTTKALNWAEGAGLADLRPALQRRARDRRIDLHASGHGSTCGEDRPALSTAAGHDAADRANGAGAPELREGTARVVGHHRCELRRRSLDSRHDRTDAERRQVRIDLRRVGRHHRAHPLHRPLARRSAAGALRTRATPAVGGLGRAALPRHPAARRPRRRAEGDGPLAAPAPAARDLRAARRWRDLRLPRDPGRATVARSFARRVGVLLGAHRVREVVG